jgi:hypothetical protein
VSDHRASTDLLSSPSMNSLPAGAPVRTTLIALATLLLPALPPVATAQVAPAGSSSAATARDEALVLSPFVISTDRDTGFVAASSLAGGRLAGDLKDTPVAYSVQTREFIDALGLDSVTEASKWSVNVADIRDQGATEIFGAPTQISFRGGSSAATQRDFFPFAVNFDSYNLERIDYARGPNAVLFGNGDYSGTINAVTRTARTDKTFHEVRASYGSWANQRFTLDSNLALNRRFALRLDLLYADRGGWRRFDMERKKAATLASTINVTATTQLRLQGEVAELHRNNPFMVFTDRFSGWDGVTVVNERVPTTGLPADATARGYSQWGNATTPVLRLPAPAYGGVLDVSRTAQTLGGNANANVSVGGQLVTGPSANIAGNPYNEALNLPVRASTAPSPARTSARPPAASPSRPTTRPSSSPPVRSRPFSTSASANGSSPASTTTPPANAAPPSTSTAAASRRPTSTSTAISPTARPTPSFSNPTARATGCASASAPTPRAPAPPSPTCRRAPAGATSAPTPPGSTATATPSATRPPSPANAAPTRARGSRRRTPTSSTTATTGTGPTCRRPKCPTITYNGVPTPRAG